VGFVPNPTLSGFAKLGVRVSRWAEGVSERLGGLDVITVEGDVLPAEGRDMGEKLVWNDFAARSHFASLTSTRLSRILSKKFKAALRLLRAAASRRRFTI
jgi:hypothetical protein